MRWRSAFGCVVAAVLALSTFSCYKPSARDIAVARSAKEATAALESIPVPQVSYFQERRTIAKWAAYWDKPNIPTFVYLFVFDKCIGYYVVDGKPASTRSYLTPEERVGGGGSSGYYTETIPDIDGTYGDNNPGIRFFTAGGVPVEFGGPGTSYLYSAAPLPIDVPQLDMKRQK